MSTTRTRDLTSGKPFSLVLRFAFPLLFGYFFQQLYSFVDAAIVGKTLGSTALAAVGTTGSINFLVLGLCTGLCSGFAIPIAQAFGARDESELRRYVANAAYLCVVISIVVGLITGFASRTFLIWMNTPAEVLDDANAYISLIFFSIPAIVLYNMTGAIIRSLGDSKTPVYFLVIASVINIVLDLFFILVLHTGVVGAALATVISQAISGLGCLLTLTRKYPILRMQQEEKRFSKLHAQKLLGIGLPMGLQFSITAIGSIAVQSATNVLGTVYVASVSAGNKVFMFFTCVFDALATTMATFAGQNLGAKKLDRIKQGLRSAQIIGIVYSLLILLIVWLFGNQMLLLFLNADETTVIHYAYQYLLINTIFAIPLLYVDVVRLTIQGMGFSPFAMIAGVMEMIARCIVGFLLIPAFGYIAGCFSGPVAWIMADAFLIPAYLHCMKGLSARFQLN